MANEIVISCKESENWTVFNQENDQENANTKVAAKPGVNSKANGNRRPFQIISAKDLNNEKKSKDSDVNKPIAEEKEVLKEELKEEKKAEKQISTKPDQPDDKCQVSVAPENHGKVISEKATDPDKSVVEVKKEESKEVKVVPDKSETVCKVEPEVVKDKDVPEDKKISDDTNATVQSENQMIDKDESISVEIENLIKDTPQVKTIDSTVADLQPLIDIEETRFLDYHEEIQLYLMKFQTKVQPSYNYIKKHKNELNDKMRVILIDWMVEVVEEYQMTSETFFLAVSMVDRFLSIMGVKKSSLQLLGTSALFVASKFEEIYPPDVNEYAYITDNTYDKSQILFMEINILKTLGFLISVPTVHYFLRRHLLILDRGYPQTIGIMAEYLCHLSALDCEFSTKYYPNDIAACAIIVAIHVYGLTLVLDEVTRREFFPGQTEEEKKNHPSILQACTDGLCRMRKAAWSENKELSPGDQQAVYRIYSSDKKFSVALFSANSENFKLKF